MKIACIIMASGLSQRFGSNKLLAQFNGKSLIEIILDKTNDLCESMVAEDGCDIQFERLVLTRTKEVQMFCEARDIDVIFHELPNRNDAVKLGVEHMKDCDGIVFCTCDQPLLKRDSIRRLIHEYQSKGVGIYRLAFDDKVGNPILFSKEYFGELCQLPPKKGGAFLATKHADDVILVGAFDKWELYDVDTPDDIVILSRQEGIRG